MERAERTKIWEKRIAEFKASGLSVPKWCAEQDDISVPQMRYWLRNTKDLQKRKRHLFSFRLDDCRGKRILFPLQ